MPIIASCALQFKTILQSICQSICQSITLSDPTAKAKAPCCPLPLKINHRSKEVVEKSVSQNNRSFNDLLFREFQWHEFNTDTFYNEVCLSLSPLGRASSSTKCPVNSQYLILVQSETVTFYIDAAIIQLQDFNFMNYLFWFL